EARGAGDGDASDDDRCESVRRNVHNRALGAVGGLRSLDVWRDQKLERAGNDLEFHGEAREWFAINLCVDRICVERLTDDRVGLPEVNAVGAAQLLEPQAWKITEVFQSALRCERTEFELVFVEIRFGGDFEGATVVFRAPNNYQRHVHFPAAAHHAEGR